MANILGDGKSNCIVEEKSVELCLDQHSPDFYSLSSFPSLMALFSKNPEESVKQAAPDRLRLRKQFP